MRLLCHGTMRRGPRPDAAYAKCVKPGFPTG